MGHAGQLTVAGAGQAGGQLAALADEERHVKLLAQEKDLTAFGRQEAWEEPKGRAPVVHGTL